MEQLNILHLEDNPDDALLIQMLLRREQISCQIKCVQTSEEFIAALEEGGLDLIISDFSLPSFNGLAALELAREKAPELPFVFVSGTLGEDVAVDSLKRGATDYVLKGGLSRSAPAVLRAIADTKERLALRRAEEAMIQSEFKYRQMFECLSEAAILMDLKNGKAVDSNKEAESLLARSRGEIIGLKQDQFHSPETQQVYHLHFADGDQPSARITFEGEVITKEGGRVPVEISMSPISLYGRRLVLGLYHDLRKRNKDQANSTDFSAEMEQVVPYQKREIELLRGDLARYAAVINEEVRPLLRQLRERIHQFTAAAVSDGPQSGPDSPRSCSSEIEKGLTKVDTLLEQLNTLGKLAPAAADANRSER